VAPIVEDEPALDTNDTSGSQEDNE